MFPTTPVVLEGVQHMGEYSFAMLPLVADEMDNILAKEELLFVEGAGGAVAGYFLECAY